MVSGFLFFWGDPQLLYMLLDLHETGCVLFFLSVLAGSKCEISEITHGCCDVPASGTQI